MGTTYKGLTVEIDGDTSKFTQAIKQTTTALKTAETQARKLQRASRWDDASQVRVAKSNIEALSAQLVSAASKQDLLNKAIEKNKNLLSSQGTNSKRVSQDLANSVTQYKLLEKQLESYHAQLKKMDKETNGDNAKYSKGMKNWDTYVPELLKKSGYSDTEAESYVSSVKMAQSAFNMFKKDMETAKLGEAFVDAKSEAAALEEKIEQAAQAYVKMTEKANSAKIDKDIKKFSTQAKVAKGDLSELEQQSKSLSTQLQGSPTKGKAFMLLGNYREQQKQANKLYELANKAKNKLKVSESYSSKSKGELSYDYDKSTRNLSKLVAAQERLRSEESSLITQQKQLNAELSASGVSESSLSAKRAALSETTSKLAQTQTKLEKANSAVRKTETSLNEIQLAQKYKSLETASNNARSKVDELNTSISKMGEKVGSSGIVTLGRTLVQTASPMATSMMYGMVSAADTIDSAYRDMRKTVNGTEEQFESLRQSALEFSKQSIVSADTILEIEAMGGQLGIAADSLESFAETVSNLDIATNMDSDTIAEDLGKLGSVLGMGNEDYSKFGDALVRLGNNFPALEGDVMEITTRFAGVGKVVGMSASQMLAWSTAATATGAKSEAAGSSMQRFITDMETAATKKDKKWADVLGMDTKEFSESFSKDASGTMYKFIAALGKVQSTGGSVNQTLTELGITGVRDKQLIEGLAQQYENGGEKANTLAQALEAAQTAWDGQSWKSETNGIIEAGDAMREAQQKSEGFSGSWGRLQNIGSAALNSLGDSAAPVLSEITDVAAGVEGVFEELPNEAKLGITALTGLVAASGPVINLAGGLSQAWQSLTSVEAKSAKAANQAAKLAKLQNSMWTGWAVKGVDATTYGTKLENAAKGTEKLGTKTKLTTAKIKALSAATTVATGVLGTLALAGVALAIEKFAEYAKYVSDSEKATTNLTSALATASAKTSGLKQLTDSASGTATTTKSLQELAEAQAQTAEAAESSYTDLFTKTRSAEDAYDVIGKYYGKTDATSLAKLKNAVSQLNGALGSSYEVDEKTGKIKELGDSWDKAKKKLSEYIQEEKRKLANSTYDSQISEEQKNANEDYSKMTEAKKKLQELDEEINSYGSDSLVPQYLWSEREAYSNEFSKSQELYNAAKNNIDKLESLKEANEKGNQTSKDTNADKFFAATTRNQSWLSSLDDASLFQDQLYEAGMTAEKFKKLWSKNGGESGIGAEMSTWFNEGGIDELVDNLNTKYGAKLKEVGGEWGASLSSGLKEKINDVAQYNNANMSAKDMKADLAGLGIEDTDSTNIENYLNKLKGGASRVEAAYSAVKESLDGTGITQDVFTNLYNNNGEDFSKVMAQIEQYKQQLSGLGDNAQITLSVNEDGSLSILQQTEQEAENLDGTDATITTSIAGFFDTINPLKATAAHADELDGKTAEVSVSESGAESAKQSLSDANAEAGKLEDNGSINVDVSTSGTESATKKLTSLKDAADSVPKNTTTETTVNQITKKTEKITPSIFASGNTSSKVKVTADTSAANAAISNTLKLASGLKDKSVTVKAKTDSAVSGLRQVKSVLDSIQSKSVTVTTKRRTVKDSNGEQAHGGIFVPNRKFATGGIVTHPMYSAHGLVGEAGTEAIIPLSNGHYVKPFARAVANQMQQVSSQPVVNNYYQVGNVTASDGSQVALAVKQLQRAIRMEQRS